MDSIDKVWCDGEEWCPITVTASLLSKKWHPVIVSRLLVQDELGFAELQERITDVSSKVLSDALQDLEDKGLVEREIVSEKPFRVSYSLTEQGRSLEPIIDKMDDWGTNYLETSGEPPSDIA
ncbi:helix-turn-helix transcriptional regulator [Halomicroarcula sp. F13]|uniref:Helix-turn-helix transcriptional regulator n=1 Tax=Haloarcula rubra TaxID=2487747 RepID=A0AAW4PZ41_9EURY|nr:helix-turn-helix domain-containing protein [Halomicroarcula rubra]MBX0325557.1 helix-turn-helix transcriptional regulator [Halomicroarcula rubra]